MNNKMLKLKMIITILSMSILIFIFSFSALFYNYYYPQKDIPFLSDFYTEFFLKSSDVKDVNTLNQIMSDNNVDDYYIKYAYSNAKGCIFSNAFINNVNVINAADNLKEKIEGNVAFVNSNNKELCYKEDDKYYIISGADKFLVIGFFKDDNDEILYQTPYYINIKSELLRARNDYDTVIIDFKTRDKQVKTVKKIKENLYADYYLNWSGHINNITDISISYVMVIAMVAIVVLFNCISFWRIWIDSFSYEFRIRKLVGATDQSNHKLLFKNIVYVFLITNFIAFIFAEIIFSIIRKTNLNNIQILFGEALHFLPFISATIIVFIIIMLITTIQLLFKKKKQVSR